MGDYTGRTTTQMVTVKNYPWYDGILREPNNADGTMGAIIYEDDGVTPKTRPENWYNNSVMQDANGGIIYQTDTDGNQTQIYYVCPSGTSVVTDISECPDDGTNNGNQNINIDFKS